MIRILHIIKSLGRGGAEMLLPETLALHDKDKFEFHYIYFLPWKDQMVSAIEKAGGKVKCLEASNNIRLISKSGQIKKYIEKHKIDVIHSHLPWAGFVSRWVFRNKNIPLFYTEHNKQERYHRITALLNKQTFNWQTEALAVSQDVANSISSNITPKIPVSVLLNGVNTMKFQRDQESGARIRSQHQIPSEALVIGTVAVFRFQKRLEEWMDVFKTAHQNNQNLFGVIVGDGPLKEQLLEHRRKLGLENNILMPGLQTNTIDWFSSFDVFMMTSVFEGLPIALLEAMSMECAVVSTNAGGISEVIQHEQTGLICDVEDWQVLADYIAVLTDPIKRKEIVIAGRRRVEKHFSLKTMVDALEEKYNQAIMNNV